MLRKAIVLGLAAAFLSGITESAQTGEQLANQICADTIAAYHNYNKESSGPVEGQVLANNLLAQAANHLQNVGVPNLNMLVSALRERVAIGGNYAVSMDQAHIRRTMELSDISMYLEYLRRTMELSDRLDENGARIKNVATRLSLDQCARLGGL